MKLVTLLSCGAALMALSASAYAQDVTGEVDVIGHVSGTCAVIDGESVTDSFYDLIDLGELAGADGKLIQQSGDAGPFTVICNTGAPEISLEATSLEGEAVPPDASYTNIVGYTAHLTLTTTGGDETFDAIADDPATTGALSNPLTGGPDNVTVSVDTLTSDGGTLTAGNYGDAAGGAGGLISITISPGA